MAVLEAQNMQKVISRKIFSGRRSCMPEMLVLPPPRQSISERKPIPELDNIPTRLPSRPNVRKELNFDAEIEENNDKENNKEIDR